MANLLGTLLAQVASEAGDKSQDAAGAIRCYKAWLGAHAILFCRRGDSSPPAQRIRACVHAIRQADLPRLRQEAREVLGQRGYLGTGGGSSTGAVAWGRTDSWLAIDSGGKEEFVRRRVRQGNLAGAMKPFRGEAKAPASEETRESIRALLPFFYGPSYRIVRPRMRLGSPNRARWVCGQRIRRRGSRSTSRRMRGSCLRLSGR